MATRPDKMVGMPMRIGLFCARDTNGAANPALAMAPSLSRVLRSDEVFFDMSGLNVEAHTFAACKAKERAVYAKKRPLTLGGFIG